MTEVTLVLIETAGIQEYVFGSNHLAQNIGASEQVARSTTEWVKVVLDEAHLAHNVQEWHPVNGLIFSDAHQIPDSAEAEVVYAGGGNVMLLFTSDEQATNFIQKLTAKGVREARGLSLVAAQTRFHWTNGQHLTAMHEKLRLKLASRKANFPFSVPLLGLSVTASCVFTGLPAIGYDDDEAIVGDEVARRIKRRRPRPAPRLISAVVADKIKMEGVARRRLHQVLPRVNEELGYDFVYDFDHFGDKGESSYIAVIHADGNGMGQRFEGVAKESSDNRDYITRLRTLSQRIQKRAHYALVTVVDYLIDSLDTEGRFGGAVPVPHPADAGFHMMIPFRPLVFGGDDVTFVCDGRLGLDMAAKYVHTFAQGTPDDREIFAARAGVAIVKTHYPFARAYELAEKLMGSAKRHIVDFAPTGESASVIDWHFSTTGMVLPLAEIRRREYTVAEGSLLMRPLCLDKPAVTNDHQWRNWNVFTQMMHTFKGDTWSGRRNKLLAMRDALRGGRKEFLLFRQNYRIQADELPEVPGQVKMPGNGWQNHQCGYFDAIEALDYFVSLASAKERVA